jgi:Exostosin family
MTAAPQDAHKYAFCSGDGWARRAEDAVLHGCIPVLIQDRVEEKFSSVVNYSAFALRIAEADIEKVRAVLCPRPAVHGSFVRTTLEAVQAQSGCLLPVLRRSCCR